MSEFHGGPVQAGHEVWTACVGHGDQGYEEIDVTVPRGSSDDTIRAAVQVMLDSDYMPGLSIVDISPFRGITIYGSTV